MYGEAISARTLAASAVIVAAVATIILAPGRPAGKGSAGRGLMG